MLQIEVAVVGSRRTFFGKESISKDKKSSFYHWKIYMWFVLKLFNAKCNSIIILIFYCPKRRWGYTKKLNVINNDISFLVENITKFWNYHTLTMNISFKDISCSMVLAKISIFVFSTHHLKYNMFVRYLSNTNTRWWLFTVHILLEGNNPLLNIQKFRSRYLEVRNKVILYPFEIPLLMTT